MTPEEAQERQDCHCLYKQPLADCPHLGWPCSGSCEHPEHDYGRNPSAGIRQERQDDQEQVSLTSDELNELIACIDNVTNKMILPAQSRADLLSAQAKFLLALNALGYVSKGKWR